MDTYHDEYWGDCAFDYVEILGQRYCGSSLPDPIISCNDLEVKFSSYMSQMLYAGQSDRQDVTFFTDF